MVVALLTYIILADYKIVAADFKIVTLHLLLFLSSMVEVYTKEICPCRMDNLYLAIVIIHSQYSLTNTILIQEQYKKNNGLKLYRHCEQI